jgi:transposase
MNYDHYIAVDWAQHNMAIARMSGKLEKVHVVDVPSDLKELKEYLSRLRGKRILTLEETTGAQWLYTELKPCVDRILICDPYRNRLLSEGAKNDKIDATKLVKLLRSNLLKEVYHSGEDFLYLRTLVSGYEDVVRAGVRAKNQRAALFRGQGQDHAQRELQKAHHAKVFVLQRLEEQIEQYEAQKETYLKEFQKWAKTHRLIQHLKSIPGIGEVHAVRIAAMVVEAKRFPSSGHFLSYCGLIVHEKRSGGKSYGKRSPRYCRLLKGVFTLASYSVIGSSCNNPLKDYYNQLIYEKKTAPYVARHAVARRMAVLCYGVLKSGTPFDPTRRDEKKKSPKVTS